MFFQHVAYKYIVMIADLRDNITHLSNILLETKKCCDDVLKNMEDLNSCAENGFSSSHDEILKELNESFGQRKNIFAVR